MSSFIPPFFLNPVNGGLLLVVLACGMTLLYSSWSSRKSKGLDITQAIEWINRHHAMIFDLRTIEEYAKGHLPHAERIEMNALEMRLEKKTKRKKDVPVLLICPNGKQSADAEKMLKRNGYTETFFLKGGWQAWCAADLPMTGE